MSEIENTEEIQNDNVSVSDLINNLNAGDMSDANASFAAIMNDRINDALDDKRVAVAQNMSGADVDVWHDDYEVEPEDSEEIEASAEEDLDTTLEVEDEDIQAVSNEPAGEDI